MGFRENEHHFHTVASPLLDLPPICCFPCLFIENEQEIMLSTSCVEMSLCRSGTIAGPSYQRPTGSSPKSSYSHSRLLFLCCRMKKKKSESVCFCFRAVTITALLCHHRTFFVFYLYIKTYMQEHNITKIISQIIKRKELNSPIKS